MERHTQALLLGVLGFAGAIILFALTVYPFQYGLTESLVLVGLLVAFAAFETVLTDASL